jgi:hypothetical protein
MLRKNPEIVRITASEGDYNSTSNLARVPSF